LPISNPANLVVLDGHMPPLLQWLARFGLPSLVSIAATYAILRWSQRGHLREPTEVGPHVPSLGRGGMIVGIAIIFAAILLLVALALGFDLGLPTFIAGAATLLIVMVFRGTFPGASCHSLEDCSFLSKRSTGSACDVAKRSIARRLA
jgi:arsenical pump membrane protein